MPRSSSLVVILAFLAFGAADAHAFDPCKAAKSVAGVWRFTTLVTEAKSPGGVGVNGYYELTLSEADCKLQVALTKTGYSNKKFAADARQTGSAVVQVDSVPPQTDGVPDEGVRPELLIKFPITLKNQTSEVQVDFELLVKGKDLFGRWEYTGASWESAGMAGSLIGARGAGKALVFKRHKQIKCDVACTLEGYYYDSNSSQVCEESCKSGTITGAGKRAP